jgi:hypothetical protein
MESVYASYARPECNVRLKFGQLENTSNGTDVEAEQHASEAGRSGHGEGAPSVDLRRIDFDGFILDDHANELRARGESHVGDIFRMYS